jgi:uncharacterized protein (TIGR02001 family)
MKLWKLALCATVASVGLASAAHAEDGDSPTVVFNVGVANEYSFRGLSQTRKDIQVFGGADVTYKIVYGGIWASNVDFANGTDAEVDIYGGVKPVVGPVTLDFGGVAYLYPGAPDGPGSPHYFEFKAGASVPAGPATLGVVVFHSPEFPYDFGPATYLEANAAIPLMDKLTLSGAIGHQWLDEDHWGTDGYTTGNIGVTYQITPHISIDARGIFNSGDAKDFFGTDRDIPFNARDKFVATLKATFP